LGRILVEKYEVMEEEKGMVKGACRSNLINN